MYRQINVSIEGIAPLLMHNGQTADPMNRYSRQMGEITVKRKKNDSDYSELRRIEWLSHRHGGTGNPERSNIMYYVIETNYVGPNRTQEGYVDVDRIDISTSPAMTNLSHVERTEGWCGTTNGWSVYAHGEYATIDAARAAISEKFGHVRNSDANGDSFESDDEDVVETYKVGKFAPMSSQATADWAYEGIQSDIEADTSDERIAELVAEYEAVANSYGYCLDSDLKKFMQERRQELRDELEDDA